MSHLHFARALLPDGWAEDVRARVGPDGFITEVSAGHPAPNGDEVLPVGVPGVPNVHSHAFQRAMAGLTERGSTGGDTFWSWRDRMYGFLERLDPGHVGAIAEQLYSELLRHGYTSVTEFHYLRNQPDGSEYDEPAEIAWALYSAARRVGIGMTLLPVLYQTSDFGGAPAGAGQRRFVASTEGLLRDIQALHGTLAGDPDARVGLALHSLRAVTPDALSAAVEGLEAIVSDAPIHIHVAEQTAEVEACLAWSGARPVEWLLEHAPVDRRWCAIHATHLSKGEAAALAASGAVAGLCPTTEANLGDGIFPFADYLTAGGQWAVGTDSHVSVSPTADLRLLEYGQRLVRRERNVAAGRTNRSTGRVLLDGALAGGAQASGRPVGRIAAGARADFVVLDPDHPALVGRAGDAMLDAWIFSGEDTPVRHVMVGGRWRVRDGRHVEQDGIEAGYRAVVRALEQ